MAESDPLCIKCIYSCGRVRTRHSSSANSLFYKVFIWILTYVAYASYHVSRKPISIVKSALHENCSVAINGSQQVTNISCGWAPFDEDNYASLLGSLDSAFLFAYAAGMFISGHIAERVNVRHMLTAGMLLTGLFTVLFGLAQIWYIHVLAYFIVIQALAGLFQSTGWPCVVYCMGNWFGKGSRGLIMGFWNSHLYMGNIVGSLVAGAFVRGNWGLSFIVPGIIVASVGLLLFLLLVPKPEDLDRYSRKCQPYLVEVADGSIQRSYVNRSDEEEAAALDDAEDNTFLLPDADADTAASHSEAVSFSQALKIPGVIEFSLCLFFAKLVSYTFLFWLPNYIKSTTKYDAEQSADLSTIFDVGGIFGGIAAGLFSDLFQAQGLTCSVMFAVAAPLLLLYNMYGNYSLTVCIGLLFVCGAFVNGPYGLITTAVSADLGTHKSLQGNARALATVTAIIDGTGSIGAAVGPLLTGLIAPTGWQNVFYMLIAADMLALLLLLRPVVREIRFCRLRVQRT